MKLTSLRIESSYIQNDQNQPFLDKVKINKMTVENSDIDSMFNLGLFESDNDITSLREQSNYIKKMPLNMLNFWHFLLVFLYIIAVSSRFTQNQIKNVNYDAKVCDRKCFFPEKEKFLYEANKVTCGCARNSQVKTNPNCQQEGGLV